jgi:hypothetical protein
VVGGELHAIMGDPMLSLPEGEGGLIDMGEGGDWSEGD